MYINILKKDLKHKRTMNIVLLMFIIMASMFVSSSVNNLLAITNAMNDYIGKSGIADYFINSTDTPENISKLETFLSENKYVTRFQSFDMPHISDENISLSDGKEFSYTNTIGVNGIDTAMFKVFDSNNNPITEVKDGEVYITPVLMKLSGVSLGDRMTISNNGHSKEVTVKGTYKDILFGSSMVGTTRIIVSENDFQDMIEQFDLKITKNYGVYTGSLENFVEDLNKSNNSVIFSADHALIKTMYIMDMVLAGVMLIVSICLIIISIIILRFTIVFTLNEEFREIGVMKAIGIKNAKIRWLYCIKYFAISVIGAVIGFGAGLPFGALLMSGVSENIIIDSNGNYFVNLLYSALVVVVIMLFCFLSTGKLKKFTPIDAIRNGSNGERYKGKGILKLNTGKMPAVSFMALNDILSGMKKFGVLIMTFTIGIILIIIPVNTANTLKSEKLVTWFSMAESDVYMSATSLLSSKQQTRGELEDALETIRKKLSDNGMEAKIYQESVFKFNISNGDKSWISLGFQGTNVTTDRYEYTKGTAPQNENEIAITQCHLVSIINVKTRYSIVIVGRFSRFQLSFCYFYIYFWVHKEDRHKICKKLKIYSIIE